MIEGSSEAKRSCTCGRPLRPEEKQCPHCERVAAARWKGPLKKAGALAMAVLPIAVAIVTKGRVKPSA